MLVFKRSVGGREGWGLVTKSVRLKLWADVTHENVSAAHEWGCRQRPNGVGVEKVDSAVKRQLEVIDPGDHEYNSL